MLFCLILIIHLNFVSLSSFTDERPMGLICHLAKGKVTFELKEPLMYFLYSKMLHECYLHCNDLRVRKYYEYQTSPCHRSQTPVLLLVKCGSSESHKYLDAFPGQNQKKFYLIFLCFGAMTNKKGLTCLRWCIFLLRFSFSI